MPGCCAFGCSNRTESRKAFLCIPTGKNDQQRRSTWLHRIGRKNFASSKNTRLCEDHFLPDYFEKQRVDGKRKLKCIAVPSIFQHRPQKKPRKPPFFRPVSQPGSQQPMPDNPDRALEAPQFTDNQGAPKYTEETPHCEGAPASSEGNDEAFVDGGTAMECSVAAEDQRMKGSSSVQEGEMTGGSNFADIYPIDELLVLKRQLNLEQKKRA
ncbi:hypothetical protein MRX96_058500 [Rhipicephalus microplus]